MRYLLIEDSPEDRSMLKRFLNETASRIDETDSVESALSMCQTHIYDCIILDLVLNGGGVPETLASIRNIKHLQPEAGLIVCSGMPIPNLREMSVEAGADSFIAKTPEMFRDNAKALVIAVVSAITHHPSKNRSDTFLDHSRLLQQIAGIVAA